MSWYSYSRATSAVTIAALASLMTPAIADETVKIGESIYSQTCIACHGAKGKGAIPGVSDLTADDGPLTQTDEVLVTSIRDGKATPGAALSMPANGGNPALTAEQIQALIAYLRSEFGS